MTQSEALAILKTGRNVFLTGEPGSGKTHTVNRYVSFLRSCGIMPAITASTGIAATHIGGMTIHSWSGIGVSRELSDYDLERISEIKHVARNVRSARVLVIDEVSMISADMIGMVDMVCREIKGTNQAFGGLQVVLVGDFFQLPPIIKRDEFSDDIGPRFAYESPSWRQLDPAVCYLSEQHRQEDASFLEILSAIRSGNVSSGHQALLNSRRVDVGSLPKDKVTKLFSHNLDVDRINDLELKKIPGSPRVLNMVSHGSKAMIDQIKRGCLSPEVLELKENARVMFTKNNFEAGFVNGTTGVVIGFREDGCPMVKTDGGAVIFAEPMEWIMESDGKDLASVTQTPLRLAWAITIHKSQGMSLDNAVVDLSRAFEYGQGYVALSRIRSLEGLYLAGINDRALQVCPEVTEQDAAFREQSDCMSGDFSVDEDIAKKQSDFIHACGGELPSPNSAPEVKKEKMKVSHIGGEVRGSAHTLELLNKGLTIAEIAKETGYTEGTIFKHAELLKSSRKLSPENTAHLNRGLEREIGKVHEAMRNIGAEKMRPIHDHFDGKISYDVIRLARILYGE